MKGCSGCISFFIFIIIAAGACVGSISEQVTPSSLPKPTKIFRVKTKTTEVTNPTPVPTQIPPTTIKKVRVKNENTSNSSQCFNGDTVYFSGTKGFNIREGSSTDTGIIGRATYGDKFTIVNSIRESDYCWLETETGAWIAQIPQVTENRPVTRAIVTNTQPQSPPQAQEPVSQPAAPQVKELSPVERCVKWLNNVSWGQIDSLPGIGEVTVSKIFNARPISSPGQVWGIRGIGPAKESTLARACGLY